jgi:antitoxin VapB
MEGAMQTAKLFDNGRSQAVRLPKEFRMLGKDVYIRRFNDMVMLIPKGRSWQPFIESLDLFTDDFMSDYKQPAQKRRSSL